MLLMPCWQAGAYGGVKIVNIFPENSKKALSSIHGMYLLMNANNGVILATFDGLALTIKRTAAVSALAADIVSKKHQHSMLMIGTGNLCHALIKAHLATRDFKKVFIWGRDTDKAKMKANALDLGNIEVEATDNKEEAIRKCDLISSATYSPVPLIFGRQLKPGCHLDLVGSFTPDTREADDDCLLTSTCFVDDYLGLQESGDFFIPLTKGIIQKGHIKADLMKLCVEGYQRSHVTEKTLFKSVGNAKSDLALAVFMFEQATDENGEGKK